MNVTGCIEQNSKISDVDFQISDNWYIYSFKCYLFTIRLNSSATFMQSKVRLKTSNYDLEHIILLYNDKTHCCFVVPSISFKQNCIMFKIQLEIWQRF